MDKKHLEGGRLYLYSWFKEGHRSRLWQQKHEAASNILVSKEADQERTAGGDWTPCRALLPPNRPCLPQRSRSLSKQHHRAATGFSNTRACGAHFTPKSLHCEVFVLVFQLQPSPDVHS